MGGGLQVLVTLAEPNAGRFSLKVRGSTWTCEDPRAEVWIHLFHSTPVIHLSSVSLGYRSAAGGAGLWAGAVLLLVSIMAAASVTLYKFKR